MAERALSESEEDVRFVARTRAAREAKFKTQRPVYEFLGVDQEHYKHWETSRPMPRRFVPKFCTVTEVHPRWFLSGEGDGPAVDYAAFKKRPKRIRRKAA